MHATHSGTSQAIRTRAEHRQPATRRSDVQAADNGDTNGDSVVADWLARLQLFGFAGATVERIRAFNCEQIETLMGCVTNWEREHLAALQGNGCEVATLVPVPKFLRAFDGATSSQFTNASRLARGAKIAGHTSTDNPFPRDTVLRTVWQDAFDGESVEHSTSVESSDGLATPLPDDNSTTAATSETKTTTATTSDLSSTFQQFTQETDMTKNTVNPLPQLHTAEAAQREMEEALEQQVELEFQLDDKQRELSALKRAFDKAGARARHALQRLAAARAGVVPHTSNRSSNVLTPKSEDQEWETRIADAKRSLQLESPRTCNRAPRTNCRQANLDPCNTRAIPIARQTTVPDAQNEREEQLVQDEGAKLDLCVLKKGALQQLTKCREGIGLTAKQIEKLKDAVNGITIAALEQFQRETCNWDQAIKGFGPEGITQLQDAQLELRTRFPMPTAHDTFTLKPDSQSLGDESETDSTESIQAIDIDEAEEWLDELIYRCDEIEQEITNLDGIRFLRGVKQQAEDMLDQLQLEDEVTLDQTKVIQDWQHDVEAWSSGVNENEEELLEEDDDTEDEEELDDEADEDYDEEFDDEDYDNEADFDDDLDFFDGSTDV